MSLPVPVGKSSGWISVVALVAMRGKHAGMVKEEAFSYAGRRVDKPRYYQTM